jgi:autotransporter-associated beta strand protein
MSIGKARAHFNQFQHHTKRGFALAAALAAAFALAPDARALTIDWSGVSDTVWSNNGNWSGSQAPADSLLTDIARFNLASYTNQPSVTAARRVNGIIIDSASGPLTIGGPGALTIGSSGITMNAGAGATTIDAPLVSSYLPTSAGFAGLNTATWANNSVNTLALNGLISHQVGSLLNFAGTGTITTNNLNTNGILGNWATTGTGSATRYATNLTNAAGGTIDGLTGSVATDVDAMIVNTDNYELTNTGPNALTNSTLNVNGDANTIRYSGSAHTIQLGGTATTVSLSTGGILNAGSGKLSFTNGSSNVGGLLLTAPETVLNAASGDIELSAPIISTSAADRTITVTGPNKVGFNTVTNSGTGQIIFNGFGEASGVTPSSRIMIGDSHTLTFNATAGDIRVYSPIVDNQDGTPSAVVISTTGANRVRFNFPQTGTGGAPLATYSGGLTVTAGSNFQVVTNFFGSDSSLGTGTLTLEQGATLFNQASFTATNNNASVWKGDFSVINAGGSTFSLGTGQVTLAPANPAATAIAITNNGVADPFNTGGMYFGSVTDQGRDIGLTLNSGSMKLTGTSTFTGDLTILSGKVFLTSTKSLNPNNVVVLNSGAFLDLGGNTGTLAGLQDGPNIAGSPAQVITLSSGNPTYFMGSGNYTFSGNISGGVYPENIGLNIASTGTQTLAGINTFNWVGNAVYQGVHLFSGTLKLDFTAPTAPADSTNILFNGTLASAVNFGGGTLVINGNAAQATSQTFGQVTAGSFVGVPPGSGKAVLVNNGADVLMSFGNLTTDLAGGLNFTLPSGAQTATNGVRTTASNAKVNVAAVPTDTGIIGGRVTVTANGTTDFATSNAVHVAAATWDDDGDPSGGTVIRGALPNGTPVSFNTVSAGSGLQAGRLYYVIGSDNATFFKVAVRPNSPQPVFPSGTNGTLSIDTQGNLVPFASYLTNFTGNVALDNPAGNYLLTGSLSVTAFNTVINSLKIDNTTPGTLDYTAATNGLTQFNSNAILFTGSADYAIIGDPRYRLNGLAGELIIHQFGTGTLTINVKIRNNPLTKNGPGTLVLTSIFNDFQTLNLNEGTINFNQLHALGTGTRIIFNGGILQYASGYTGPNDITLGGGAGGTTSPDPQLVPRAVILGPGGGTIDTNGNDVAFASAIGGGDANGFNAIIGNIPTGGLTKAGAGKLTLAATNNYLGATTLAGGTLSVSSLTDGGTTSSIGISLAAPENLVFTGGTLQYTGATGTTNRNFTLTQNGGSIDSSSATNAALTFSNTSAIAASGTGARTLGLTGTSTGVSTMNLQIVDASGVGNTTALSKTGVGTWALTNANTYSGGTNVSNGILLAKNASGSATGSGSVAMDGGTLGGNGSVGSIVAGSSAHTIAPSATLASNTATTLTAGGLTTNANTTMAFNLVTPGVSSTSDRIKVTGANALALNGGAITVATAGGAGSLGWYNIIEHEGFTGTLSGVTVPATVNNIAYVLDGADPDFIRLHRGFMGDANDDGTVNFSDFIILSQNFGQNGTWNQANFTGTSVVDFNDFVVLSQNFGNTIAGGQLVSDEEIALFQSASQSFLAGNGIPEPTSLALLGIGAAALLTRRRKN